MRVTSLGVIGCGYISKEYLETFSKFDSIEVVACGDLEAAVAEEKADEFDIGSAGDVDTVLDDPDVDIVVNLTPPSQHADVSEEILRAGKHVYVEKPLAGSTAEARRVLEYAAEQSLLVGCAPDMFIGPAFQSCRSFIEAGEIGTVTSASIVRIGPGHESWHPNPDFYYRHGGGPLFDFAPYYLTPLVSFFGPVEEVTGRTVAASAERRKQFGIHRDDTIEVEVPTDEFGIVTFENDVTASIHMSFEVQSSTLPSMPASVGHLFEVYGTEGSITFANPSDCHVPIRYYHRDQDEWKPVPIDREYTAGRGLGVVDLARAVRSDWQQRVTGALGYHVLDVMESIRRASDRKQHVDVSSTIARLEPIPEDFP